MSQFSSNTLLNGITIANDLYTHAIEYERLPENFNNPQTDVVPEARKTYIRPGVLSTAKGSAYMEYGRTKVLAIVAPPRELTKNEKRAPMGIINCFVNFAAFATRDLLSVPQRENDMGNGLRKALEPMLLRSEFSNFQLDVRVLVIDDDGCLLSTAVTCCGVALVESGISAYDIITSSTVCLYRGTVYLNPDANLEYIVTNSYQTAGSEEEHGILTITSLSTFAQIAACYQIGYMSMQTCFKLVDYTIAINKILGDAVSHILVQRVQEQIDIEKRNKVDEALEDKRINDLIKLMHQNDLKVNSSGSRNTNSYQNVQN